MSPILECAGQNTRTTAHNTSQPTWPSKIITYHTYAFASFLYVTTFIVVAKIVKLRVSMDIGLRDHFRVFFLGGAQHCLPESLILARKIICLGNEFLPHMGGGGGVLLF